MSTKQGQRILSETSFHKGDIIEVDIKKIGINGEGVGYVNRQVVFIPGALPDETVKAKVTKVEVKYAEAELVKVIRESKYRIKPLCPVYEQCGGCTLQHLEYKQQLKAKGQLVKDAITKYSGIKGTEIRTTIGMDKPWDYRNKAQLPVKKVGEQVLTGLYEMGTHKIVDISSCPIQHPQVNKMVKVTKEILKSLNIPIYNEKTNKGIVKHIVARVGFETGQAQLTLITATKELPREKELIKELKNRIPQVKSIMQNINPIKTSIVFGNETKLLWGEEKINERLGELDFTLSPRAFFQLNPEQTVKLYNEVEKAAALTGKEIVVDAYCGVGTIGLWLARKAKQVYGMDIIPEAIHDAKENARAGHYKNVTYTLGKTEELLPRWMKEGFLVDVLIVDPPRKGLDEKLIHTILNVKPKKVVYVSCNPSTLGKDLSLLVKGGYKVKYIQPLDMFPQTANIESITLLEKR